MEAGIVEKLGTVREHIHTMVSKNQSPTTVGMGRNAIMFLDTAYMWMSTLDQMIVEQGSAVEQAAASPQELKFVGGEQPPV